MEEKYSSNKILNLNEPSSPLEKFAKKVFDKLIEDGLPPLPSYYKVYFFIPKIILILLSYTQDDYCSRSNINRISIIYRRNYYEPF